MASLTMTPSSFMGGATLASRPTRTNNRCQVAPKASVRAQIQEISNRKPDIHEETNTRRAVMLSAAAVALWGINQGIAMAAGPKPGSPEAKKAYAPVCVTMPTAKICRR